MKDSSKTTHQSHCLTDLLELVGLPMFTDLNWSTCHLPPDGLLCYVTDIRKTPKPDLLCHRDEAGGLESGRRGGGEGGCDASCSLGSLCV